MPRCVDCGATCVVPSTYAGSAYKCTKCRNKPKTTTIECIVCLKKDAVVTKNSRRDRFALGPPRKCDKCVFKHRIECIGCGITAIASEGSRFCNGCEDDRKKIFSNGRIDIRKKDPEFFYDNRVVQIEMLFHHQEHDGYCSDHGDITTNTSKKVLQRPCLRRIKSSDVVGNRIVSDNIIALYTPDNNTPSGCNGYCGSTDRYEIISATIVSTFDWDE